MSDDLISRKTLFNKLFVKDGRVCPDTDIDNLPIMLNAKYIKQEIRKCQAAYDVDKVIEQLENEKTHFIGMGTIQSAYFDKGIDKAIEIVKSGGVAND